MANLQVKSIDDDLYKALGQRAAQDNRSISQEVVMMIHAFLASPSTTNQSNDDEALKLAGSWGSDDSAEEIVESILSARNTSRFQEGF